MYSSDLPQWPSREELGVPGWLDSVVIVAGSCLSLAFGGLAVYLFLDLLDFPALAILGYCVSLLATVVLSRIYRLCLARWLL